MNAKTKALIQLATSLSVVFGLRAKFKQAREDEDRLALADLIMTTLSMVTGVALAVRALRQAKED